MEQQAMIFLTIVMMLHGKPSEENLAMQTWSQCWEIAQVRVKELMEEHPDYTSIGAGCTIDRGNPI
jgi:hypothetical protein